MMRLKNAFYEDGVTDPDKEMLKYYDPADFDDPFVAAAPVVTLAAGSAAAIAKNAAACYVEGWEQPMLTIDEKTDPTARYKLATKLKGLFMHETDGHYDDYRKVRFAFPCFDFLLTYLGTLDVR